MFVLYDRETMKIPVKVWLETEKELEASCREQALHLANLPFLAGPVCLMPDTHAGMGMPIGGVIASEDVIIPNAVGVDIGCGMAYTETGIRADDLRQIMTGSGNLVQAIIGDIMRNVPVGFAHHKQPMSSYVLDRALDEMDKYEKDGELLGQLDAGYFQIGTLGGGNHFIELQEDDEGFLSVMIHSGSRHFGKSVCDYFHQKARALNQRWYSQVPDSYRLAFLPVDSPEGQQYLNWMQLSMDFAAENREKMMLAVIPGAMGSYSYMVMGLGNEDSFCSSSHGAGRRYSRKGAMEAFTCEEVILDLERRGVVLGKKGKADVAEESRFAYKDIEIVMENQKDLVIPVKRLKTIGVVKG